MASFDKIKLFDSLLLLFYLVNHAVMAVAFHLKNLKPIYLFDILNNFKNHNNNFLNFLNLFIYLQTPF